MPAIIGQKIQVNQGSILGPRDGVVVLSGQKIQSQLNVLYNTAGYTAISTTTPATRAAGTIQLDIQKLDPGSLVDLYEVDTTRYTGGTIYRFHTDVNQLQQNVVWQGNTYSPFPIDVSGFESSGTGSPARPKVKMANISGYVGALTITMNDLVGCKFTRKRTFSKYLDAVNFVGGINPSADSNAHFPDEIYYIDRKAMEDKLHVEFELASVLDINGVLLPKRMVTANNCAWKYRSAECGFTGGAIATEFDIATTNILLDKCGKRFASCELRFGIGILPYGGFPAVGMIK